MALIFANNVAGTLGANIGPSDSLILLGAGQGSLFPTPAPGESYIATIVHQVTNAVEIVRVVSRSADVLTVERGIDGTTPISFVADSVIELRVTAQVLRELDWHPYAGQPNGVATLGPDSRVPSASLPTNVVYTTSGRIPVEIIPDSIARVEAMNAGLSARLPVSNPTATGTMTAPNIRATTAFEVNTRAQIRDDGTAHTVWLRSNADATQGFLRFGNGAPLGYNGTNLMFGTNQVWHEGTLPANTLIRTTGNNTLSGNLTVGGRLHALRDVDATQGCVLFGPSGTTHYLLRDGSNWTFNGGFPVRANTFVATSDERLKTSISEVEADPTLIEQLVIYDYEWKDTGKAGRGVLAQEVRSYAPVHVNEGEDGFLSVDKASLALEMVHSLYARVRELEEEIEQLRSR